MSELEIGVGPMSLEVIDAVIKYANSKDQHLMLIASRNQIECSELGGGYVGGLNTRTFVEYVRARDQDGYVKLCRDHSGPFFKDDEIAGELSEADALEKVLTSMKVDAQQGFDLIHIDLSRCENRDVAMKKISTLLKNYPRLEFEFGSDEHSSNISDPRVLEEQIVFIKKYLNPKFVVVQTGSYVRGIEQVGHFDPDAISSLIEIADEHGVKLKEHNADYLDKHEVRERKKVGISGMNIAPQLGVLQTNVLFELSSRWRLEDDLEKFKKIVLEGKKWKKWLDEEAADEVKILCSAHYYFRSPECMRLSDKINQKESLSKAVERKVFKLLDIYCC